MRGVSFVLLFALLACSKPVEELTDIDWDVWKEDRNGCQLKRLEYLSPIRDQLERLKRRSEMDIVKLMGRPDETELYKRNQKFYTYFLAGSPACDAADSVTSRLVIRFNAMGLAKEVAIE
jgi:outer membrane protein assembly factor BamE (lipoprotein component of BamABCDE complex)